MREEQKQMYREGEKEFPLTDFIAKLKILEAVRDHPNPSTILQDTLPIAEKGDVAIKAHIDAIKYIIAWAEKHT